MTQRAQAISGRTAAERVDQDRRVEEELQRSADPAHVGQPLGSHPALEVRVPFVLALGERSEARLDVIPATLVFERPAHRLRDERAAATPADPAVKPRNQGIVERYVQTRGHKLAHRGLIAPLDVEVSDRLVEALHGDRAAVGKPDALAPTEIVHPG